MTIFEPRASNIGDINVPILCPLCCTPSTRDALTCDEKQYLIDTTYHHSFYIEYCKLIAIQAIVDRFPGTNHPLLRNKLDSPRRGFTDEQQVAELLSAQPILCEFLRHSNFSLSSRYLFVRDSLDSSHTLVESLLVACDSCPSQYMILTDEYFHSIGSLM